MNTIARYNQAVKFLENLSNIYQPFGFTMERPSAHPELHLKRMRYFLRMLGNSEKSMKFVHVTGTAGKGSVAHLVHRMLVSDGKRVGLFTSPFVTTTAEKIVVNNRFISARDFARLVGWMKPFIARAYTQCSYGGPTYFEVLFALALMYFREQKCAWSVLEVGCGGRFDATNVIPSPKVAVITNVDYDHTQLLGKTLKKIAYEKAGIVKKGCVCITGEQRPRISAIIEKECAKVGAHFLYVVAHSKNTTEGNVSIAEETARTCGVSEKAIVRGGEGARLPARFEIMQAKPLVILDGAHNRIKMKSTIERLCGLGVARVHLVIGFSEGKDYISMMRMALPFAARVYATSFQNTMHQCVSPGAIVEEVKWQTGNRVPANMYLDTHEALSAAFKNARAKDTILITGSFYLAGELRAHWYAEGSVVRARTGFPRHS
ncbi:MAG: FolC bifunctional protein [Candidatus Magasanikbacteria bacterium GW2011_GWA2_45_39]|uniref:tetrahydrofolate synthase n=1 Tax=Candidatus Magasanikbacteria bacterium GW2011_GWA2_45_39 TaxID=1619041 RepID=A0A0G1QEQ8_9BACT|nr:MAG: FolC bifunctional protein [Candidatus Magasanikbacteria bacterium GW2011_GWA2_45_39]HBW74390.1 hypothetical protein [Candidatus Magasanikbacteria bacterium]